MNEKNIAQTGKYEGRIPPDTAPAPTSGDSTNTTSQESNTTQVSWSFKTEQYQNIMLGGVGALLIIIAFTLVSINSKLKASQKQASEIRKSDYNQIRPQDSVVTADSQIQSDEK